MIILENEQLPFARTLFMYDQGHKLKKAIHIWFIIWEKGANVLGNKGTLVEIAVAIK